MPRQYLTDLELMVLLAVLRLGDEAYGVSIADELRRIADRDVALAVVYATAERLEGRGLLSSSVGEPTAVRGGRAKKYIHVTAKGLQDVREALRAVAALRKGIGALRGEPA